MAQLTDWDEPRTRQRKSTRKWCKGKPGVLHDYRPPTTDYLQRRHSWLLGGSLRVDILGLAPWRMEVCEKCGKERWQ